MIPTVASVAAAGAGETRWLSDSRGAIVGRSSAGPSIIGVGMVKESAECEGSGGEGMPSDEAAEEEIADRLVGAEVTLGLWRWGDGWLPFRRSKGERERERLLPLPLLSPDMFSSLLV